MFSDGVDDSDDSLRCNDAGHGRNSVSGAFVDDKVIVLLVVAHLHDFGFLISVIADDFRYAVGRQVSVHLSVLPDSLAQSEILFCQLFVLLHQAIVSMPVPLLLLYFSCMHLLL